MKVTYKELEEALKILKFKKKSIKDTLVYSFEPLNAVIKLRIPKSPDDLVQAGILSGHAFILQEKGVIKSSNVLFRIIENQRFIRENVLV